ncbi:MAG: hypothetical protein IV100_33850 [Myxococcales bacterium]|nr:hypothetical protein [Myxococcales bacterium]
MSTTLSMWLGIAFVVFAVVATILQAWLWSFPMVPDPGGPDPNGRSTAPRFWTQMHRLLGGLYVLIYVVLMVEMIPRLWEYQVELPARTVMHAVMGIVIGVMLVAKIAIIRWFQHFGKSLPALGLGLLAATIVLATLSIPFAVRAHDFGAITTAENVERVKRVLTDIPWEDATKENIDALVTTDAFASGQRVLAGKCTDCHDIRTILQKPRSGEGWYDVVVRMAKKPTLGEPITAQEIAEVTSFLVAITPNIQASARRKRESETDRAEASAKVAAAVEGGGAAATTPDAEAPSGEPTPEGGVAAAVAKPDAGKALVGTKCVDCHELSEIDKHGGDTVDGWAKVVTRMVSEQGMELSEGDARTIVAWLARTYPKKP